jgi:hypothetical protein
LPLPIFEGVLEMNKAQELLSVVKSIHEDDGMGPLSLNVGSKVVCVMDGQEMAGVVKADDAGMFYDAEKDAYYVDMGDHAAWCAAADVKAAPSEAPAVSEPPHEAKKPKKPKKPGKRVNEDDGVPDIQADEPQDAVQLINAAYDQCMSGVAAMKECMGMMKGESFDATSAALDGMEQQGLALKEAMDSDGLSIPDDGGGAGVGGTMQQNPGSAPEPTV